MGLVTGDTDEQGNFVLRAALKPDQRESLKSRAAALRDWLVSAEAARKKKDVEAEALQLMIAFGAGAMSRQEAAATAIVYAQSLYDIPLWAVRRACMRFRNSQVTADELGITRLDTSFRPSTAQVRKIAIDLVKPFGEESTRIWMTLRGTVGRPGDDAETRARVAADMKEFVKKRREQEERDLSIIFSESRRENNSRSAEFSRIAILHEYENHGLTPPPGQLCSLSMLKSMGWTIQDGPGGPVLMKPPEPPKRLSRGARGGESS